MITVYVTDLLEVRVEADEYMVNDIGHLYLFKVNEARDKTPAAVFSSWVGVVLGTTS